MSACLGRGAGLKAALAASAQPEERKSRMEARALELKAKREAERVQFVEDMNYRKWRASCDDLREARPCPRWARGIHSAGLSTG